MIRDLLQEVCLETEPLKSFQVYSAHMPGTFSSLSKGQSQGQRFAHYMLEKPTAIWC